MQRGIAENVSQRPEPEQAPRAFSRRGAFTPARHVHTTQTSGPRALTTLRTQRRACRRQDICLVADAAALALAAHLAPEDNLAGLARALRSWATAHPHAYRLVFSGQGSPDVAAAAGAPVIAIARGLAGSADELAAARLVTAWATGFISMELAGAFQLGGDVEAAFDYALDRLTSALTAG